MTTTKIRRALLPVLIIALCLTAAAEKPTVDTLVGWVAGGDAQLRIQARQLLPREGAKAVHALIPLLAHEDPEVSWTALRLVEDLANATGAPGREDERYYVAEELMGLVLPGQSDAMKKLGFRLLPLAVREGSSVVLISTYLRDAELREKARRCLQHIGTAGAARDMTAALDDADPAFQVALLRGLAMMEAPPCLVKAAELTESKDAGVRAAAARALSWTGNPAYANVIQSICAQATPETAFEANDALLRLADAMALRGGNWDHAMGLYRHVLTTDSNPVHQAGAISGLGRFGDETVIDGILAALKGPNGAELEGPALQAFGALKGRAATRQLLDAYADAPPSIQPGLLATFGGKRDPLYLPLLSKSVRGEDPVKRRIAMQALASSELAGAVDGVAAYAEILEGAELEEALASLKHLANTFRDRGEKAGAGKAFLALYKLSGSEDMRLFALDGIKQFPIEESFDVVLDALGGEEMQALPIGTVAGIAKAMYEADRKEEATKVLDALMPRLVNGNDVREAMRFLSGVEGHPFQQRLGVISAWWIAGPFPWSSTAGFQPPPVDPNAIDLSAKYSVDDREVTWKKYETGDPAGMMPMGALLQQIDNVCAYAYTRIEIAEDTDGAVRVGSDDGIRVWVNGEVVHENNIDRGCDLDQDIAPAKFKAGVNEILVQSTQNAGGWAFLGRLTKADSTALPFKLVD